LPAVANQIRALARGKLTRRANHFWFSEIVSFCKNISFAFDPNQFTDSHRPVPQEGRLAIVTNAGRDAMDVGSARDERGLPAYGQVVSF
jgi:hypothetical protein